jgi:oligopeptidase B
VKIQDFQVFKNHIALCEREHGLPKITVYSLPSTGEPIKCLLNGQQIEFVDEVYDAELDESEFNSSILRFSYSSMKTPPTVYDYDMETGTSVQKKIQAVSLILPLSSIVLV